MPKDSIRFSIQIPGASDAPSWIDKVRRAEDHGFYSISVPDHLSPGLPQLAPLLSLAAAATVTSSIRLAITVLNNDFRHPVMLAKEIGTLDLLSNGRVDLGMGAGWLPADYLSSGIASWDAAGERVSRLEESVTLLRQLLSGDAVTFKGDFYEVAEYVSLPRPVQELLPLMIGGSGRRMLTMAAEHAQIVSIVVNNPKVDSSMKGLRERIGWIKESAGDRIHDLTVGLRVTAGVLSEPGTSREDVATAVAATRGVPVAVLLDSPFTLVGDDAAIRDRILELHDTYGISYFTLSEDFGWQVAKIVEDLGSPA